MTPACTSGKLLQDPVAIDRRLRTLITDHSPRAEPIPSGTELFERLHGMVVEKLEITSQAELAYAHGGEAAALAACGRSTLQYRTGNAL